MLASPDSSTLVLLADTVQFCNTHSKVTIRSAHIGTSLRLPRVPNHGPYVANRVPKASSRGPFRAVAGVLRFPVPPIQSRRRYGSTPRRRTTFARPLTAPQPSLTARDRRHYSFGIFASSHHTVRPASSMNSAISQRSFSSPRSRQPSHSR